MSSQEYSDEELPLLLPDTDSMQTFYRNWGYLPPLDVEVVAIIDAIIADPIKAGEFTRMGAEHPDFPDGLDDRNVDLGESSTLDSHADHIKFLAPEESASETDGEKELHGQLWTLDQARCNEGSNEAFFQRTLMMSLIARHSIIYQRGARNKRYLDFSVEEAWTCPPMPTRAYGKGLKFLTQPKPDLAVCFRRQSLIPDNLWKNLPNATKRLACYENTRETGRERVFHFLTIEAKKANISADDTVGKRQSLNNASQALHNMFEFFRDAGAEHENNFFTKVRFFSVVASTEGLTIRIHRATREPDKECFIILDYSLRFEYQEFLYIQKHSNFDRETVIRTFKTILIAYGANGLLFLFSDAAKALVRRLKRDPKGLKSRQNVNFYRYGQTVAVPKSRTATPAPSRAPSGMGNSSDMLRGGTFSPMQSQVLFPVQTSNALRKRLRAQSEDTTQSRTKRQRRK